MFDPEIREITQMHLNLILLLAAGFACVVGFLLWKKLTVRGVVKKIPLNSSEPIFLFENNDLIDATSEGYSLIADLLPHENAFDVLMKKLGPHFPDLRKIVDSGHQGKTRIDSTRSQNIWLIINQTDTYLRLIIKSMPDIVLGRSDLGVAHDVRMSELAMLRDITQHSRQLIWQEDNDGKLLWANQTYLDFADKQKPSDDDSVWPNCSIFPDLHDMPKTKGPSTRRMSIKIQDQNAEHWFDVNSVTSDTGSLHYATDANAIVRADQERRNLVQTLGKTFAELSTGLAIFDKRRELTMFNPAILDLTGLQFDFLCGRPTLDAVLDKLRESRMLPEPKNYANWREQFHAVETAAKNGTYSETWALPNGQTYRVSGRPHPDGAFALFFEDITAELSLTRRFRADIETSQAALDAIPDAIAVFSTAGNLVLSNDAYAKLWGTNPAVYHEHRVQRNEIKIWQSRCASTQIWKHLREFTHQAGSREPWSDSTFLDDGRRLTCHTTPIAGGRTLVRFSTSKTANPALQKITMHDPAIQIGKR